MKLVLWLNCQKKICDDIFSILFGMLICIIHNAYITSDRRGTALSTSDIYNDIFHNVKEINSFGGHLIKGNIANCICIYTN